MTLHDPAKFILLLVALIGGFLAAIVGAVVHDPVLTTSGFGIVTGVVGYMTGNGVLARSGNAPVPAIGRRRDEASPAATDE